MSQFQTSAKAFLAAPWNLQRAYTGPTQCSDTGQVLRSRHPVTRIQTYVFCPDGRISTSLISTPWGDCTACTTALAISSGSSTE